jgi:hypothetical protein
MPAPLDGSAEILGCGRSSGAGSGAQLWKHVDHAGANGGVRRWIQRAPRAAGARGLAVAVSRPERSFPSVMRGCGVSWIMHMQVPISTLYIAVGVAPGCMRPARYAIVACSLNYARKIKFALTVGHTARNCVAACWPQPTHTCQQLGAPPTPASGPMRTGSFHQCWACSGNSRAVFCVIRAGEDKGKAMG